MNRAVWHVWRFALAAMVPLACSTSEQPARPAPTDAGAPMDASPDATVVIRTPYAIQYVIVLVKENHTFDNLFGAYPGANGTLEAKLSDGGTLMRQPMPQGELPTDPPHDHRAAVMAYRDGGMNGFDLAEYEGVDGGLTDPLLPFRYYTQAQIPNYYAYANRYTLCDAFFTTTMADSFPAYMGLIAAQSPAYTDPSGNVWDCEAPDASVSTFDPTTCAEDKNDVAPCFSIPSIVDALPAGVTWRSYTDSYSLTLPLTSPFDAIAGVHARGTSAQTRLNRNLLADLAAGDLANITYVWGGDDSEHPDQDICPGENDTVAIATALMQGPHWAQTLLIVTYDDWGGFYDHVAPTVSPCSAPGGPFNTGFRVPTLLISPWARRGVVYHTPTEQASIPRLIEDLFGMPRLSSLPGGTHARDANAGDLLGALDFTQSVEPGLILQPRMHCP